MTCVPVPSLCPCLLQAPRRQAVHPVLLQRRPQHIRSRSVTIGISGMRAPSAGRAPSAIYASWRERAELPLPASRRLNLHAISHPVSIKVPSSVL
ncbi:hypothetical protein DFH09DRAFT_1361275 [Mycena vulgaris]|nr:hypothetical protein DFH09DRAFT_1361275 [Mycena vulgaris]